MTLHRGGVRRSLFYTKKGSLLTQISPFYLSMYSLGIIDISSASRVGKIIDC